MESKFARFSIGGLGGMLPVLASLLAVDLSAIALMVDHRETISTGMCVGYGLRVAILFILGGIMAMLNTDIHSPLALVQIGIAAPALITSFVTGAALNATPKHSEQALSFIGSAHAEGISNEQPIIVAGGLLGDIVRGMTPGLGTNLDEANRNVGKPTKKPEYDAINPRLFPDSETPTNRPDLEHAKVVAVTKTSDGSCIELPMGGTLDSQYLISHFPSPEYQLTPWSCPIKGQKP